MTHKYTLLVDAVVIPGSGAPDATAIAWAEDTVIAIGSDEDVASISRGDSHVFKLAGATVAPSVGGVLEVGGSADLDVTDNDPRASALGDARLLREGCRRDAPRSVRRTRPRASRPLTAPGSGAADSSVDP
jgi:hypothetical protein